MILSDADVGHLHQLLKVLLPGPEAAAILARHAHEPRPTWREIGRQLGVSSLGANWLYRKGLKRLRPMGRLLSALLLEAPASDR